MKTELKIYQWTCYGCKATKLTIDSYAKLPEGWENTIVGPAGSTGYGQEADLCHACAALKKNGVKF